MTDKVRRHPGTVFAARSLALLRSATCTRNHYGSRLHGGFNRPALFQDRKPQQQGPFWPCAARRGGGGKKSRGPSPLDADGKHCHRLARFFRGASFSDFLFPQRRKRRERGKGPRPDDLPGFCSASLRSVPSRPARWIEGELELCLGEWNGFQMRRRLLKSFGWCHVLLRTGVSIVRARSVHELN